LDLKQETNPRISDSPRRANSPLCGERNCRTPRPHHRLSKKVRAKDMITPPVVLESER